MSVITNKEWWAAAGVRALKTACQTAVATIGTTAVASEIEWGIVISSSLVAGMLSILTSIGGLPEVSTDVEAKETEE